MEMQLSTTRAGSCRTELALEREMVLEANGEVCVAVLLGNVCDIHAEGRRSGLENL